jgi:hypothetical protein
MTAEDKEAGSLALHQLQATSNFSLKTNENISRGIEGHSEDSEIARLIAICRNVEIVRLPLHLSIQRSQKHLLIKSASLKIDERKAASEPLSLSRLETLSFKRQDINIIRDAEMSCWGFIPMLSLPTLRNFRSEKSDLTTMRGRVLINESVISHPVALRELSLANVTIGSISLEILL